MTEYTHEVVKTNEILPVFLWIHTPVELDYKNYIAPHWHQAIELSYTINGKIDEFIIEGKVYKTNAREVLLVNSQEIHSIKVKNPCKGSKALTITYTYDFVKSIYPEIENEYIKINDKSKFTASQVAAYKYIQKLLDDIVELHFSCNKLKNIDISIKLLELLKILVHDFSEIDKNRKAQTNRINQQLSLILDFIQCNYRDISSLNDVAKQCHLSKEYLSRFFKKTMGITVGQYIAEIKAQKAYSQIILGKDSLTQVALNNGFSGIRTMDRALLRAYGKKASEIKSQ